MPSLGGAPPPRLPVEDSYLELLADTLESLDLPARGQFLQRYFRAIAHLDLRESQSLQLWDEVLACRRELAERLGRPVSLKTALMDVLSSAAYVRVPVMIEYDELKRLQVNAVTDPLTGLYNRRLFSDSLDREITRARRYQHPFALVLLDLHRFKEVNDKYGHPRGDDVLRLVGQTLRKSLRTSDSAFRIGGDEFALLLPQTDEAQALALSRRVETAFAEELRSLQVGAGVSMDHGVATCPHDGEQADVLIHTADERLYRLKHSNHGRVSEAPRTAASEPPEASRAAEQPPAPRVSVPSRTISIESKKALEAEPLHPERPAQPPEVGVPPAPASQPLAAKAEAPPVYPIKRKAERVTMAGTNAYAVLGESGGSRARVLDLGFGGVGLMVASPV